MEKFDLGHLKEQCICCEEKDKPLSKEHVYSQWILKRTNTFNNPIRWGYKHIPGKNCVIPICSECNAVLGTSLEGPVSNIFDRMESGLGFNDYEAELLVRWLWKITGMFFWIVNKDDKYGANTLKDRVLGPFDNPRDRISIAISLIDDPEEDFGDYPMGIDVVPRLSNVLAAGVFSKTAIIVHYSHYSYLVPDKYYTKYTLSQVPLLMNPANKVLPKNGFKTGTEAVGITSELANGNLLTAHEHFAALGLKRVL